MLAKDHQFPPLSPRLVKVLLVVGFLLAFTRQTDHGEATSIAVASSRLPVLAFFYPWYSLTTWCACHMSDLPESRYDSAAPATLDRQIEGASGAGITGFISSWWGPGDPTDVNFARLQGRAQVLQRVIGRAFTSTIYLETDSARLQSESNIVAALRYVITRYAVSPLFFHWRGKPVIFIWDPLGGGRTLATWADIRRRVDPNHRTLWSAEGTDVNLLSVFDGLHLFSAADWALLDGTIGATDLGFRSKIDAFNGAHGTQKIWAAGVEPGYDDRRVPGRADPHVVPRRGGATYRASWTAALASRPDWITISTFNEWFEGSMIEPSMHFHNLYLNLTRRFAG